MIVTPPPAPDGVVAAPLFIGSEVYRGSSYGSRHPLRVPRVSTVMDLARALDWLPADRFRTSPRAKPAALDEELEVAARDCLAERLVERALGEGQSTPPA